MNEQESQMKEEYSQKSLDELFDSLDDVLTGMEQPDVSLEDSFRYYNKGMMLLKNCNDRIEQIEKQVQLIDEKGELHEF